jgi:uncharacterized protein YndB with AHSA1/START domain
MTSTTHHNRTEIIAPEGLPIVEIVREFDAPRERVFRAHTDPELLKQWLGPRRLTMRIEHLDMVRGGSYRYFHVEEDGTEYGFWGSIHDVRQDEMITQTFGFDGAPDDASLEKATFEDLGNGRTRVRGISVVHSVEARDAMLRSGMIDGVNQGYERLDELLARG